MVTKPDLRDEILEMTRKDQAVQQIIVRKSQSGEPVDASDWARQDSIFKSHIQRGKAILDAYGWPGYDLVGEEGSQGMFLIVQHADADPTFQKYALKLLQMAHDKGQASGKNVAYLVDRVRVGDGLPQVYGSQLAYDDRACPIAGEIEDPEQVDNRRAEKGLEPIAQYLAKVIELQGKAEQCKEE